jgi:hypothetical protein
MHGLGVGISTVFEIFGHFLYQGRTGSLHMVINFTPSSATWHKQEYIWFRGGDLNSFWNIWAITVSRGIGPPHMVMTYIPSDAPWYKEQGYIQFWGGDFDSFNDIELFLQCTCPTGDDFNKLAFVPCLKILSKFELYGPIGSCWEDLLDMFPL